MLNFLLSIQCCGKNHSDSLLIEKYGYDILAEFPHELRELFSDRNLVDVFYKTYFNLMKEFLSLWQFGELDWAKMKLMIKYPFAHYNWDIGYSIS